MVSYKDRIYAVFIKKMTAIPDTNHPKSAKNLVIYYLHLSKSTVMKTIDRKSLLLGILATVLFFLLSSSKSGNTENDLQLFGTPEGISIYNKSLKTIFYYKIGGFGMATHVKSDPYAVYKISEDGSGLTKN